MMMVVSTDGDQEMGQNGYKRTTIFFTASSIDATEPSVDFNGLSFAVKKAARDWRRAATTAGSEKMLMEGGGGPGRGI